MQRRDLSAVKTEFTTQKLRQEWAEHEQVQEHILESLMTDLGVMGDDDVIEPCDKPCDS